MSKPTFRQWICAHRGKKLDYTLPLYASDFLTDAVEDKTFPRKSDYRSVHEYMRSCQAIPDSHLAAKAAWLIWWDESGTDNINPIGVKRIDGKLVFVGFDEDDATEQFYSPFFGECYQENCEELIALIKKYINKRNIKEES